MIITTQGTDKAGHRGILPGQVSIKYSIDQSKYVGYKFLLLYHVLLYYLLLPTMYYYTRITLNVNLQRKIDNIDQVQTVRKQSDSLFL